MGSSFTSVHVRTTDHNAVKNALTSIEALPAFVAKTHKGWVSAYPNDTEGQDEEVMKSVCTKLSATLKTGVFGFIVHDSDIMIYVLAENGVVVDHYNSWPSYFDGEDDIPSGGNAQAMLPYCVTGTTVEAIEKVLRSGGKGLPGGMAMGLGGLKNQFVKASPWWAKPVVWTAVSLMELKGKTSVTTAAATASLPAEMQDAVFRGDRMATACAELLGISYEYMSSGYEDIEEEDSLISRRSLIQVGDAKDKRVYEPTEEDQARGAAMMKEMVAPLHERPSLHEFVVICKNLLNAPSEQDAFKRLCVANGLSFKQSTMNMMGLGPSPVWWTFNFDADRMLTRKFGIVALPKGGTVQCASAELSRINGSDDLSNAQSFDAEFEYAASEVQQVFGKAALSGKDKGDNQYVVWRGTTALIFLYQSPPDELDPRSSIEMWWEPWQESAPPPAITGILDKWLHERHPDLF